MKTRLGLPIFVIVFGGGLVLMRQQLFVYRKQRADAITAAQLAEGACTASQALERDYNEVCISFYHKI